MTHAILNILLASMDWIAASLSLFGLILNSHKKISCWAVWMVSDVLWITHMSRHHQWANGALNVVFLGLNYYGWRQWSKKK